MSASAASASDFADVKPGSWYYSAVDFAVSNNLFSGTGKGTFSPEMPMTRGMFATVLAKMYGMEKDYGKERSSPFGDVKTTDWYFSAAMWANDNGIMAGTDKGFEPNKHPQCVESRLHDAHLLSPKIIEESPRHSAWAILLFYGFIC